MQIMRKTAPIRLHSTAIRITSTKQRRQITETEKLSSCPSPLKQGSSNPEGTKNPFLLKIAFVTESGFCIKQKEELTPGCRPRRGSIISPLVPKYMVSEIFDGDMETIHQGSRLCARAAV